VIKEKLKMYVDILNDISDDQKKYAWLMLFGKKSMDMQKQYKQKEFEIHGCQTRTWLVPHFIKDKYSFSADSDALISRGMVNLLADVFSGSTSKEILSFERKDLEDLRLDILLTPGRRNGVHGMLQKIREYAQK